MATASPLDDKTRSQSLDDAEMGLGDCMHRLPVPPPALLHHTDPGLSAASSPYSGTTPYSSTQELSLLWPPGSKSEGVDQNAPAPARKPARPSKGKQASRWIRFRLWFNMYRRLFVLALLLNLTGVALAALGRFHYAKNHLGALVLGNLLCAVLMRNELFLRFLYLIAIYGLRSWAPVTIKMAVTSILQHVGGVHSGCAISGASWHPAVIASGIVTNVLVIISILSAFPWVRNYHHNVFETHHRFIGWLGIATSWMFVVMGNSYDIKLGEWRVDANSLLSAQEFWFALFITAFVLVPWFTLREVPVQVEIPSPKVATLSFDRGMQQGLLDRISRISMLEYHAFGIISEDRHAKHHYMVCGVQGDFTRGLLKFAGVGHASAMFKRGIRVCTGTGIGAALSTCIQSPDWFLIWIGSDQEKTFGPTISGLIHKHIEPARMILWDSKERGGRPG
ncbi:hypothetical protein B0T18DRAFT_437692 [Schizothecium vesticola]|uniref:Uncharacterized protein n=1 Tax=Schizothecium vesticola TaxID=314040 RepID=A0AA40F3E9_9PEZI|nr:hypothetical protein B0T18DRAFT_437692 [Schizothecium vesticola]